MAITHVMRADEWISSFPKHILLYQAFGWEPPQFGHLPIVLGPDKRKLSKRHGATSVDELRAQGYLPEALVNLMALLGWSYDDRTELFTREQLIGLFTLERIHASPAIFDRTKLDWMNGHYIRKLESADLAERLMPFLTRAGVPADRETVQQLVPLVRERLKRLDEIVPLVDFFFKDELAYEPAQLIGPKMTAAASLQALRAAEESLRRLADFEEAAIEQALRSTGAQLGLTAAQFFGLVRVAVTGKTVTPPLIGTLRILGRDKTLARLRQAITTLERMAMEAERVG